tara:strand:- start:1778 stop:2368 length:591 start_codon:yes stop_codon:yes gene_type:complete
MAIAARKHRFNLASSSRNDDVVALSCSKKRCEKSNMSWMVEDPAGSHSRASGHTVLNASLKCEKLMGRFGPHHTMEKQRIDPPGTKKYAPYSPGVMVGNTIWLSGQIDVDSGDTIEIQTQGALNKIDALLGEAGASKHDVVFAQVLLKSMEFYAPMNEVYGAWVESMDVKPARAAFAVDALPADALVEIVVQAIRS